MTVQYVFMIDFTNYVVDLTISLEFYRTLKCGCHELSAGRPLEAEVSGSQTGANRVLLQADVARGRAGREPTGVSIVREK